MTEPNWLSTSIMAQRGVARGKPGAHTAHREAAGQVPLCLWALCRARAAIAPGDIVTAETIDAFGGAMKSESDLPSQKLVFPFLNPQNGPIAVEGAEKGDCSPCISIRSSRAARSRRHDRLSPNSAASSPPPRPPC